MIDVKKNLHKEKMSPSLVILGAGGHAISVTNVAKTNGMNIIAYVDDDKAGGNILGVPILTKEQYLSTYETENIAIAIADNTIRERVYNEYKSQLPHAKFPPLIHQSAVIGIDAKIGDGTIIMPLCNIGPKSMLGECCIVNTSSSIDHDCVMKPFSSIAPRVAFGGNVTIGLRSAVSIGAVIKQGITIGNDVVIGANSYVNKAFQHNVVAYGTPCKVVRTRTNDEPHLG